MKILITFIVLTVSALSAFAVEKAHYSTEINKYSNFAGAPWAQGTWNRTDEDVVGSPCFDFGFVETELECYNQAARDGYRAYQVTTKNHYTAYHGTLWDKTSYDFLKCFACR